MATDNRLPEAPENEAPVHIGTTSRDALRRAQAITKAADRHLIFAEGGSGLASLYTVAQILKRAGVKFGDESTAVDRGFVPYAIFVDTDTKNANEAMREMGEEDDQDAAADERQKEAQLQELIGMGVQVCKITDKGLDEEISRRTWTDKITPGRNTRQDRNGSRTDPRLGMLKYLAMREKLNDPNNPRSVLDSRLKSLLGGEGTALLGERVTLTLVGSAHGGTGPIALPIMMDLRNDLVKALAGTDDTAIQVERIILGAEASTIDRKAASKGLTTKHRLNHATTMILANSVVAKGGLEIAPGEWISGIPDLTILLNGKSPHRWVPQDGGHTVPAWMAGKLIATNLLGGNNVESRRSDMGSEVPAGVNQDSPNTPLGAFVMAGVSEVVTSPDRAELNAQKRRSLFQRATGFKSAKTARVREKMDIRFPAHLLDSMRQTTPAISLVSTQFGEGREAKEGADSAVQRLKRQLKTELKTATEGKLNVARQKMQTDLVTDFSQMKQAEGLGTTGTFLRDFISQLDRFVAEAKRALGEDCSDAILKRYDDVGQEELAKANGVYIPPVNLLGIQDKAIARMNKHLSEVAKTYTEFASLVRDREFFTELEMRLINPLKEQAALLFDQIAKEVALAKRVFEGIAPDATEAAFTTPYDVALPVELEIQEDPALLRVEQLGAGEWTVSAMQALVDSVSVTTEDIKLQELLTRDAVAAVEKYSHPLTRPPRAGRSSKTGITNIFTASVPVKTVAEAKKFPLPGECDAKPVGVDGSYAIVQEFHGVNALMEDGFTRECLEFLLATPPTMEEAKKLVIADPSNPKLKDYPNRESQFTFKGQAEKLLLPVFQALAHRKFAEDGDQHGDIVEACPGSNCGVAFYRSKMEMSQNIDQCPGCRRIPVEATFAPRAGK